MTKTATTTPVTNRPITIVVNGMNNVQHVIVRTPDANGQFTYRGRRYAVVPQMTTITADARSVIVPATVTR